MGVDKWSKTKAVSKKKVLSSGDIDDPLALLKEQLSQQDIKFEQMNGEHTQHHCTIVKLSTRSAHPLVHTRDATNLGRSC
eukprot:COSAG02_NODE_1564_length_11912_cov_7.524676_9_plen_80_part_00